MSKKRPELEPKATSVRLPKDLTERAEALKPHVSFSQLLRDGLAIAVADAERRFGRS